MSEKQMKRIRKQIYGDMAFHQAKYLHGKNGQTINLHRIAYRKAKRAFKLRGGK